MTFRLRFILCTLFTGFFFCGTFTAFAGDEGHALSARIAKARQSGVAFQEVSLFAPASAEKHPVLLTKETILQTIGDQVSGLYESHPEAISLLIRSEEGREYRLDMMRAHPTAEGANMGYIDAAGRHKVDYTEGLHYQGSIAGTEQSLAAMSVFANGEIMLLFANDEGNFVVGKLEDGSGKYILYNDKSMRSRPEAPCGVVDMPDDSPAGQLTAAKTTKPMLCNKVQFYWESTYNLYVNKASSLVGTQNYLTALFNQIQTMYANEKIAIELKTLYIWVTQDDYSTATSSAALDRFRGHWNALGNAFDGDIAQLITRTGLGRGGLAYVDVVCNKQIAYAYCDIQGSYQTVPTYSWDVEVTTHETGHNMGSRHTHWCGWMTGAGGTCGSIDNCTTQETTTTPSCPSCGATNLNSAPVSAWTGTVMSYCHMVTRGINLANGFGPLPGAKIRTEVAAGSCLNSLINARLEPTPICGSTGAVTLTLASNNYGTSPYAYNWSNSAKTQSLTGLSSPGAYSVTITDSNGCSNGFYTEVIRRPLPGNGITPAEKMPICCSNTSIPLILEAAVPQDLTSCQSVYWLRSSTSPGTYAVAKSIFDTTQAANIVVSTNNGSISSSEGASLSLSPPVTCASKQTYYYTPMVVQLPQAAHNITASGTGSTAFTHFSSTIGRYVSFPDETTLPTVCDLLDTPSTSTISVTVTSYTGRANNMRLVVFDATGIVIYERLGLAGNGIYTIPGYAMAGPILQAIDVLAYDFNCTTSACTGSTVAVAAVRTVTYGARTLSANPACTIGTSIKVEFAPNGCTKLDVENVQQVSAPVAELYPNPASGTATLKFTTTQSGNVRFKFTDMLGRTVMVREATYGAGEHRQLIDVRSWAKGVYFLNIDKGQNSAERMKFVVE